MKANLGYNQSSCKQDHILEIDQHKSPGRLSHQKNRILKETFHFTGTQRSVHSGVGEFCLGQGQWGKGACQQKGSVLIEIHSDKFSSSCQKVSVSQGQGGHIVSPQGTAATSGVRVLAFSTCIANLKRCTMNTLLSWNGRNKRRKKVHPTPTHITYQPPLIHKLHNI